MTALSESSAGRAVERAADLFAQLADYQREGQRRGVPDVLAEIYSTRAWESLGYATFDAACDALLGGWRIALPAEDRRVVVAELRDEGMSTRAIASVVGVGKSTVQDDLSTVRNRTVEEDQSTPPTIVGLDGRKRRASTARPADDTPRAPQPIQWDDRERTIIAAIEDGRTAVANLRTDTRVIEWANQRGKYTRADRRTDWGNPFETPADGDRLTVIGNYRRHYLPHKGLDPRDLRGRLLGCWCAPLPCHADVLAELAELP